MGKFLLRRLLQMLAVILVVLTITFMATHLSPIDPARAYSGMRATTEQVEAAREKLGLNRPVIVQYGLYVWRIAQGDLGRSFVNGLEVRSLIAARLPATIALAAAAMVIQITVGVTLGIVAALNRGGRIDRAILFTTLFGVALPSFVLGFVLLYVLAFRLGWFPLGGADGPLSVVLPALTIAAAGAAWYSRMLRSTALNILAEDYMRTARAKGLSRRVRIFRHMLRNAISPIVTLIGLDMGVFLGGVLIIEKVFAWPGIGLQAWQGIASNDMPVVLGTVVVTAVFVTVFNLLADIANALIDPRLHHE